MMRLRYGPRSNALARFTLCPRYKAPTFMNDTRLRTYSIVIYDRLHTFRLTLLEKPVCHSSVELYQQNCKEL